jgi:hypothetical protein
VLKQKQRVLVIVLSRDGTGCIWDSEIPRVFVSRRCSGMQKAAGVSGGLSIEGVLLLLRVHHPGGAPRPMGRLVAFAHLLPAVRPAACRSALHDVPTSTAEPANTVDPAKEHGVAAGAKPVAAMLETVTRRYADIPILAIVCVPMKLMVCVCFMMFPPSEVS